VTRTGRVRRRRIRIALALAIVAALVGAAIGIRSLLKTPKPPVVAGCEVTIGQATYSLDLAQASNATTIAAVGKRLGLPDHAVTVALATALQESGLHNLGYGDLDSLGLFQQRPSQGWGTPAEILTPHYAAAAFFEHLAAVPGWETLPVTVAAQQVQRSSSPDAYAQWESEARTLAEGLTGEVPTGLSCQFPGLPPGATASLSDAMSLELGPPTVGVAVLAARGWTVSAWLVGHATQFGITSVAFDGRAWTAAGGAWGPDPVAGSEVIVTRVHTGST
jgi:hypothetical protein